MIMAPPRDILERLSQSQCQRLVDYHAGRNRRVMEENGCWVFTSTSTNGSGYGIVKAVPEQMPQLGTQAFLLHRVALVARTGVRIAQEASHRCGIRRCFNPAHLCDESHEDNESRKCCVGPLVCAWHGHPIGNFCTHFPECIRAPRTDLNCCLRLKESDPEGWASSSIAASSQASSSQARILPIVVQPPESEGDILSSDPGIWTLPGGSSLPSRQRETLGGHGSVAPPTSSPGSMHQVSPPRRLPQYVEREEPSSPQEMGPPQWGRARLPLGHSPPSDPSSARVSRRQRRGSSPDQPRPQPELSLNDPSSSPPVPMRSRRRSAAVPSTQQQRWDDYFEADEAQFTQYREDAQATRAAGGQPPSSSSYHGSGQ